MVGGDICLLMGWQCLNWLRRGEDGDVADIVPCGRCDLKVVLKHYYDLQFSPAVETIVKKDKKNPKRVLRDVKKQLQNNGIGTKSQQALKLQHELKKEEYKSNSKHKKQMDAEQKFKLKQQKKKAKHRGH